MRFLLLPLFTVLSLPALAWELSDVSVLLPMPKNQSETAKLLLIGDAGPGGALIPDSISQALPKLVYNISNADNYRTYLRAVGFRFDPCFSEGPGPAVCRRQIRIVWQPVKMSSTRGLVTLDASLHTFYDFDEAGWEALINQYRDLIAANPQASPGPLNVNPRIKAQGFDGAFYKGFKKMILANCGARNLTRVTVMSVHPGDNEWHFSGFDIDRGVMRPIQIALIGTVIQTIKTGVPAGFDLKASVRPEGFSRLSSAVYANSLEAKNKYSERELQDFASDVLHIENPLRSNPGTIDCASCHLAGPGAQWLRLNFSQWNWSEMAARAGWQSGRDLTNVTIPFLKPRRLRGFGFFYADPLIAQRTINESAVVADMLEKTYPLKTK